MNYRANPVIAITILLVIALGLAADPSRLRGGVPMQTGTRPDPKALLQAAADACLKLKTIEYVFARESAGNPGVRITPVTATIRQARADVPQAGYLPGNYAARGTVAD